MGTAMQGGNGAASIGACVRDERIAFLDEQYVRKWAVGGVRPSGHINCIIVELQRCCVISWGWIIIIFGDFVLDDEKHGVVVFGPGTCLNIWKWDRSWGARPSTTTFTEPAWVLHVWFGREMITAFLVSFKLVTWYQGYVWYTRLVTS
jgi:hypothetical protein